MASPPFNINQNLPGDTDIVSQHPTNARTFRDIVESWILVNHNVQGRHDELDLDVQSSLTGIDSVVRVWANSTGYLKKIFGSSGTEEYVGVPPATIIYNASPTAPAGYVAANGAAISRTGVNAALFAAIGTTYGAGDGSTTFNVPDIQGRVIAGKEGTATRLTTAGSGIDGATTGATGGVQNRTITETYLPALSLTVDIPSGQGSHTHGLNNATGVPTTTTGGSVPYGGGSNAGPNNISMNAATLPALTGTAALEGDGTTFAIVQPTIVIPAYIKL